VGVVSPGDKGRRHMAGTGGGAGEPARECPASGEVNWIPTRRPARGSGARDHPPPRPRTCRHPAPRRDSTAACWPPAFRARPGIPNAPLLTAPAPVVG
jgi:hypothetical protein